MTFGLGNTVAGPVLQNQSFPLPVLLLSNSPPPSSGDINVPVGGTLSLAPGRRPVRRLRRQVRLHSLGGKIA